MRSSLVSLVLILLVVGCGDAGATGAKDEETQSSSDNASADEGGEAPLDPSRSYPTSAGKKDAGTSSKAPSPSIVADEPERPIVTGPATPSTAVSTPPINTPLPAAVNPFVDAAKDPFSTFGADVDTASYDYLRQSLSQYHQLPQPEYVRVEDYVNFFKYTYPTPAGDSPTPFTISLAAGAHPAGRASTLLRVGIQAKAAPPRDKPANLIFLVDVSGSMASSDKMPLVQRVLTEALSVLAPTDKVSIVSYASDTRVRLPPTPVSSRDAITTEINGLVAGGSTNGASGIDLAYQQAAAGFVPGGINHVILCTDGDFNLGITRSDALVALIKSKRDSGVTLTALGFGRDNLNDEMMERVSNAGNGSYSIVFNADQAVAYANQRLFSTIAHVAKDVKLQVEFNAALVQAYRLLGYEDRAVADNDFRNDTVDGGEVGAEHRVTALYEVILAGQPLPTGVGIPTLSAGEVSDVPREVAAGELVRVKVRYKAVTATDADPASEVAQALTPTDLNTPATPDFNWAAAVASFAEILRRSPYVGSGELAQVERLIGLEGPNDPDRVEFKTLFATAKGLLAPLSSGP